MKLIKPDFYDEFHCIADKCPMTCCKEWRIAVDDDTYHKWENLSLCKHVTEEENGYIIKLDDKKKCPQLSCTGLCHLVEQYGDTILSETCQTFPRQRNLFKDREEVTLVTCCPVIVDFLANRENITLIGDVLSLEEQPLLCAIRTEILSLIEDKETSLRECLLMSSYLLLDMHDNEHMQQKQRAILEDSMHSPWKETLTSTLRNIQEPELDTLVERNELFMDIAVNYMEQGYYKQYLMKAYELAGKISLGLYQDTELLQDLQLFYKELGPYETLFRNDLWLECYTSLLNADSSITSMITAFQWIVICYAVTKHFIFLQWICSGKGTLKREMIRDCIVIIARMTGYDDEDIEEYLENSFESLVWDFGYVALLTGN